MSEYNFYQIDSTGVDETDRDTQVRSTSFVPIRRAFDSKISFFGSNSVGIRLSTDITKVSNGFESKDELADYEVITADTGKGETIGARAVVIDNNPYVSGSTVKKTRDDQLYRIGMYSDKGADISVPGFDVSDTKEIVSGMTIGKNWPSEGWRSFGGKYDFTPYSGGGIH